MICVKCREGKCGECVDSVHRKNLEERKIPGVQVGGNWCDCHHKGPVTNTPGDPNDC